MYGIDILVKEHENIERMAVVMRQVSMHAMQTGKVDIEAFEQIIAFVRNYADRHHHKKEEDILFDLMKKELGKIAQNIITNGMLVEHDLGRLHIRELEEALNRYKETESEEDRLDIIVNATAYTYLIHRHIEKENAVVFTYGEKNLIEESKKKVDQLTLEMEKQAQEEGIQEKYLDFLVKLEKKYKIM